MITIYKTNTMSDAADFVMDAVSRVNKAELNITHTVIVPDRASLEAERALLKVLKGSFNVQVKTFRRLAADVLPKLDYLSKQSGILALSALIKDNKDKLVCFTKGVTPGFVESVYETICMMKYCRIRPEALLKDMPQSVSGKAKDIALLYDAYMQYTKDRFIDSADKMDLLSDAIAQTDFAGNSYFYIYDFDNFSVQELSVVEQLMKKSLGVTVACCASDNIADRRLYLNDIYHGVLALCRKNGIEPNVIQGKRYCHRYAEQIGENLFRYGEPQPIAAGNFLEIHEGATRLDEVYSLACKIRRYVQDGGRFKDIYVVASDVAKYTSAISAVFDKFEIPYFCDRQFALVDHAYANFILDYLLLCRNNGKLENVLRFVKNYLYCGFDDIPDNVFLFENHCLKYNVSYRYDSFALGRDEPYFDRADSFRASFNKLYCTLQAPNSATVNEYAEFVSKLVECVELKKRNETFAQQQADAGLDFQANVTSRVAEKFDLVLLQAQRVMGDRVVKLDEFVDMLRSALASVKISVIPLFDDCVIFANMAKARKHDIKFLALLGANQGAMPIVKGDTRLFSDRNLADLAKVGVDLEPLILTENRRERFSLFQLLLEPKQKLYVSYAAAEDQDKLMPSPFVKELCTLFSCDNKPLEPTVKADEDIYTPKQALEKLVLNMRKLKDNRTVDVPSFNALKQIFDKQLAPFQEEKDGKNIYVQRGTELYFKGETGSTSSVSRITDFFKCPFRFFLQYGLNVKPRTVAELQSSDLGNVLHAVLENYVRDMDVNEEDAVTKQKAKKWFDVAISDDFYRGLKNDSRSVGVLGQLRQESVRMCLVVKTQLRDSDFVNFATELSFGGGSDLPPVEVHFDGDKFDLVGKIDRVDVCGDRFLIIDYKSGNVAASYDEKELFVGHKLQLPVYVKAAADITGKRCAGFYYFAMHDKFVKMSESDDYAYNGRTLMDVDVACQIDRNLKNGKSKKLGLSLKSDGGFNMKSGKTRLLTDEQMNNQTEYTFRLIRQAGKMMKKGYSAVNPYDGACKYCDYKDVCDFNDTLNYNPRKLTQEVRKEDIKGEQDEKV